MDQTGQLSNPWVLLTATAALMAFLVAIYTLVGRERKAPYIINSVFQVLLLCLFGAVLDLFSALAVNWGSISVANYFDIQYAKIFWTGGAAVLLVAFILTIFRVYRITVRFTWFVDSFHPKHHPWIRRFKAYRRRQEPQKPYEHNPKDLGALPDQAIEALEESGLNVVVYDDKISSIAINLNSRAEAKKLLVKLSRLALDNGCLVQFLTVAAHPYEFTSALKGAFNDNDWQQLASKIVVIDAYTPHFGFTDSIYDTKTREVESSVTYLKSKESFAGIHTASSEAFNHFKEYTGGRLRPVTLVLYENVSALSELESVEQYRLFLRHVIPSERAWGGMLSVFVETGQTPEDLQLLRSQVGAYASSAEQPANS